MTESNNKNILTDTNINKKENRECIISLILSICSITCFLALNISVFYIDKLHSIRSILNPLVNIFLIFSFVFMIRVRVKYRKNIFGKLSMISYILFLIIVICLTAFFIYIAVVTLQALGNELSNFFNFIQTIN